MTVITMPDGQVVDFGDMPSNEIKTLIRRKYPDRYPAPDAAAKPATQEPYAGQLLPFSKNEQGEVSFDPNAGLFGVAKRAVEFPAAAVRGEVDPKSDEGIARAVEAATVVTPVSPAARAGYGWMGVKPKPKTSAVAPSGTELKAIGGSGFDLARSKDVRYKPSAVQNMAMKFQSRLFKDGYRDRPESASETFAEIRGILSSGGPGSFVSIDDLHAIRQSLGNTAQNFNRPTDRKAAVQLIKEIDEFITNPDPAAVVAGPAAEAGRIWKNAMGDYAAGSKSGELKGLESNAEIDAAVANSGANLENRIRARVGAILKSRKEQSGYTPQEIELMDQLAKGTTFRNWVRKVGNLGGGGGALAALMGGMGVHFGGPLGLAAAVAVPLGAKAAGNQMAKSALRKIDETVRQRSPFHQSQVATSGTIPLASPAIRSAPTRGAASVLMTRNGRSYGPAPEQAQMTPEQWNEYLKQKYARDQGA